MLNLLDFADAMKPDSLAALVKSLLYQRADPEELPTIGCDFTLELVASYPIFRLARFAAVVGFALLSVDIEAGRAVRANQRGGLLAHFALMSDCFFVGHSRLYRQCSPWTGVDIGDVT